ncbi:MAG: acyltransferase [Henriciella sp.]|nr:acyltransferase [Henriciella sp.]
MSKLEYRPEIDGLRAIAVLPVILFHAGFHLFSGGYVGVDVFFVISGFLITGILIREIDSGTFSVVRFYERRARRILPALYIVVICCVPFAVWLMLPDPFENFAQSAIATTLFANNILLDLTSGYWDLAAEFKPLLHTWSLAVEEQFYFVVPILLWGLWKFGKQTAFVGFALLAVASFAICQYWMARDADHAFYMLHTRAWELLIGSLAAFAMRSGQIRGNDLFGFLGLGAIIASIFWFDENTQFPGYAALLPTLGTAALLLFAQRGTYCARFLSLRAMVWVGLLSYSLYLWHQPIFAFARIYAYEPITPAIALVLIGLTFALSYLSWKFVETPFRSASTMSLRSVAVSLSAVSVAIVGISAAIYVQQGLPGRFFDLERNSPADFYIAYNMRVHEYERDTFPANSQHNLLIAGNSEARDFVNMLTESDEADRFNISYRTSFDICRADWDSEKGLDLLQSIDGLIMVSYSMSSSCWEQWDSLATSTGTTLLFVGRKNFGYNLNAFTRIPRDDRPNARVKILPEIAAENDRLKSIIPPTYFLDILGTISEDNRTLPVFDEYGALVSADRVHVTKPGAILFGRYLFATDTWELFLERIARNPPKSSRHDASGAP